MFFFQDNLHNTDYPTILTSKIPNSILNTYWYKKFHEHIHEMKTPTNFQKYNPRGQFNTFWFNHLKNLNQKHSPHHDHKTSLNSPMKNKNYTNILMETYKNDKFPDEKLWSSQYGFHHHGFNQSMNFESSILASLKLENDSLLTFDEFKDLYSKYLKLSTPTKCESYVHEQKKNRTLKLLKALVHFLHSEENHSDTIE